MMIMTRAQALTVTRTADLLGVPLPKAFARRLAAATALASAAENIGDSSNALNAAVLDAIAKGVDYHFDENVTRLLLDAVLVRQCNIVGAAGERANHDIGEALAEHADTILQSWAKALEPHSEALAQAATELPADLGDTKTIIARGATAMRHWSAAQEASKCWLAAVDGFQSLAAASGVTVPKNSPLVLTAADFAALAPVETDARSTGTPITAWLLACHQIPLHLATIGDYMERSAVYQQQHQAAAAEAQQRTARAERAALTS